VHQICAQYGKGVDGTPSLNSGNCACTQPTASDWVNATAAAVPTTHDDPSRAYTVIGTGVSQTPFVHRRVPEHDAGHMLPHWPQFAVSVV
jgi:hypothetical protein